MINEALKDVDSSIKIISEPGRYYVTSAFKLVAQVQGKKRFIHENEERFVYYINEGVFGSFKDEMMGLEARVPTSLRKVSDIICKQGIFTEEKFLTSSNKINLTLTFSFFYF